MDNKDINNIDNDPRFIRRIFNYCDRWCERCAFTSRCRSYVMTKEIEKKSADRDRSNMLFWEGIEDIFEQTNMMITEMTEERGIELDWNESDTNSAGFHNQIDNAINHRLSLDAREYAIKVEGWFGRVTLKIDPAPIEDNKAQESVEVIRWYQHFIYAKIARAVSGDEDIEDDVTADVAQKEADGSAKIALTGIDRSIGAWGRLRDYIPKNSDSIMDILFILEQLRRKTEKAFPHARSFIRPGFDTMN